jgi:hypothetical protein
VEGGGNPVTLSVEGGGEGDVVHRRLHKQFRREGGGEEGGGLGLRLDPSEGDE